MTEQHIRKQIGGTALILSPLLGLVAAIIMPSVDSNEEEWLGTLAAAENRALWSDVLNVLSMAFAVFAVLALVHLLRERSMVAGQIGGGFAMLGIVLTAMFVGAGALSTEMARSAVEPEAAAAVLKDAATNPPMLLAYVGSVLFAAGLLVLAAGLLRAEAVPALCGIGLGLFAIGVVVGYAVYSTPLLVVAFAVLSASLVPIGIQVLGETDATWEHTPRFRGFHAVLTS